LEVEGQETVADEVVDVLVDDYYEAVDVVDVEVAVVVEKAWER
jgi:hypothetical protein